MSGLFGKDAVVFNLLRSEEYSRFAKNPKQYRFDAEDLIKHKSVRQFVLDEVQGVPELLNEFHALMERHKSARFLLFGSNARKLKRGSANLLAGRAVKRHLFPFTYNELREHFNLDDILRFGSLLPLLGFSKADKKDALNAYAETYLREEIQMEGLVRNLGWFYRFLECAASACGEQPFLYRCVGALGSGCVLGVRYQRRGQVCQRGGQPGVELLTTIRLKEAAVTGCLF